MSDLFKKLLIIVLLEKIIRQQQEQPAGGVPVFFAVKRKTKGGALCHYGGHFVTKSFTKLPEQQRFKEIDRQALIELSFHHYDARLAAAVEAIPADFEPSSAAAGENVGIKEEEEEEEEWSEG